MGGARSELLRKIVFTFAGVFLQACVAPNGTLNFTVPSSQGGLSANSALFWNGFTQIQIGQCALYTVTIAAGNLSGLPTTVSLTLSGPGAFYVDGLCTTAVSSVTIPAGATYQMIYYSATAAGSVGFSANASGLSSASYQVTVSSPTAAPSLNSVADLIFPSRQLNVGTMTSLSFTNTNVSADSVVAFTCFYNRDLSTTYTHACSSLPGFTLGVATGSWSWTPNSSAWGAYRFQVTATNAAGSGSVSFLADVAQVYPKTNLLFDYDADFATISGPASDSPTTMTWRNIFTTGSSFDGLLSSFVTAGTTTNGWSGSGTSNSPYALTFAGNERVTVASNLSVSPGLMTAWVAPNNIASAQTGGVILSSNNDGLGSGMTIRQSAQFAGSYELEAIGTYLYAQEVLSMGGSLSGYWKLRDTGTGLTDSSGNNNNGSYYLASVATAPTTVLVGPLNGDTSSIAVIIPYGGGTDYGTASSSVVYSEPGFYTQEIWFKSAAAYSHGGLLMGLGNLGVGASTSVDRQIWMDNSGHLWTSVTANATAQFLETTSVYNDGFWHQVAVTYSSDGSNGILGISVDGILQIQTTGSTLASPQALTNLHWRFGYDGIVGPAPSIPSSQEFQGAIAEASAYSTPLSAAQIQRHFWLGVRRCQSPAVTSNGVWAFLAATYDGTTASFYINGVLSCSMSFGTAGAFSNTSVSVSLGEALSGAGSWSGSIADVKAYSTGTQSDVGTIYTATSPRF